MSENSITVQADISADRQSVWECYTQPKHITQWNFATDEWQCPKAENDLRTGGKYSARMEAKDGSIGFDFEAIYDEVNDGKSFTYTMSDGRTVSVNFEHSGDNQTRVIITFDAENENPADMQRDGWQAILNNFKKYTEGI